MIGQLTLDVTGMVRADDPDTSQGAAVVALGNAATDRERVRELLAEHGPLSDFDLAALTGRKSVSIGKRRGELRDLGLVERSRDDAGCWVQGRSDTGTPCAVWQLTERGLDSWQRRLPVPQPQRRKVGPR